MPVTIADGAGFREVLKAAGDMRWAFVRAHVPLPALGEDDAPGRLRTMTASDGFGEAPDAFGRFPPSEDLGIEHNKQIAVFHRLLERAFKLDPDRAKERDKLIKGVWPAYNKRFFEHSGIPAPEGRQRNHDGSDGRVCSDASHRSRDGCGGR